MCLLSKYTNLFLLSSCLCLASGSAIGAEENESEMSRRMMVQESLDYCLDTIYDIKSGKLSQEEGLDQLEQALGMIKFVTWFFIED